MGKSPVSFVVGDAVEVICQDEGFGGSLYEARIVRSMPKLRRYTIEYEALKSEADPAKNHRETVSATHIRPRPNTVRRLSFEVGEKVDAFHNDGWWAGEISKVLDGGKRYAVRFPDSHNGGKEKMEFGLDEIRVHMDWIHGQWTSPEIAVQNIVGKEFQEGDMVEICSDDEGFCGAWYIGTVVGFDGKDFRVEYRDLRTDDNALLLTETMDSLHIRHIPPATPVSYEFKMLEEVDAFHNDGWWVGVISKVLEGSRYMVYFKTWNEEIEFSHSDLRLHHEWIDGKWQCASEVLHL